MAKNEVRSGDCYNFFVFKELHTEGSCTDSLENGELHLTGSDLAQYIFLSVVPNISFNLL